MITSTGIARSPLGVSPAQPASDAVRMGGAGVAPTTDPLFRRFDLVLDYWRDRAWAGTI